MLDESFDVAKIGLWEVVMALDAPKDLELPTRSVTPTTSILFNSASKRRKSASVTS